MHAQVITFVLLWAAVAAVPAVAHGGGLNAQGCHVDRSAGMSHCHRGAAPIATRTPSRRTLPPAGSSLTAGGTSGRWAYRNCSEARAADAAPVRRGQPGYGSHLDRDEDGIGCEPSRGR